MKKPDFTTPSAWLEYNQLTAAHLEKIHDRLLVCRVPEVDGKWTARVHPEMMKNRDILEKAGFEIIEIH